MTGTREPALPAVDRWILRLLQVGLAAVIVLAPLPFGSVQGSGRAALELGGALLLFPWLAFVWRRPEALPGRTTRWACVALIGLAALQLLPLPDTLVRRISPQSVEVRSVGQPDGEAAAAERRLVGAEDPPRWARGLSVDPAATASALRTGTALAVFLLAGTVIGRYRGGLRWVSLSVLVSSTFQSLYGTLSLASGSDRIWGYAKEYFVDLATGTYVNPNHYSCLLAMGLACGAGLLARGLRSSKGAPGRRHWLVAIFGERNSRRLLVGGLFAITLIGLVLSFSRAGIALGIGSGVAAFLLSSRNVRLAPRFAFVALLAAALVLPLAHVGIGKLVENYSEVDDFLAGSSARPRVWLDTQTIARDFPWTGSGFGTFAAVYPRYRSPEIRVFYSHAHNDFLQHVAESGVVGAIAGGALIAAWVVAIAAGLAGARGRSAIGPAAALAAFLLHNLVDFNFHIPANAAVAAILAGALGGARWVTDR